MNRARIKINWRFDRDAAAASFIIRGNPVIHYRDQNGSFKSLADLEKVPGRDGKNRSQERSHRILIRA
jgi:hypothetical protein